MFDLVSDEEKKEFEIRMPNVEEYNKEEILAFEKDVLGIYLSGSTSGELQRNNGENHHSQNLGFSAR